MGPGFINWLKKNFAWIFTKGQGANASLGQAFVYGDAKLPGWAVLGEYDKPPVPGRKINL